MQVPDCLWAEPAEQVFVEGITNRSHSGMYTFAYLHKFVLPAIGGWVINSWMTAYILSIRLVTPPIIQWVHAPTSFFFSFRGLIINKGRKHIHFSLWLQDYILKQIGIYLHLSSRTKAQCEELKNPSSYISFFHYIFLRFIGCFPFEK